MIVGRDVAQAVEPTCKTNFGMLVKTFIGFNTETNDKSQVLLDQ